MVVVELGFPEFVGVRVVDEATLKETIDIIDEATLEEPINPLRQP